MIFTVLVLLFIAASQNRLVSAFINGNALPAKEDAAQLNFMLRDIGLQISMMQASRNTFDLNAANYQLQQDFLRLDEVLYRLNQYELDEQLFAALREAAADVKGGQAVHELRAFARYGRHGQGECAGLAQTLSDSRSFRRR